MELLFEVDEKNNARFFTSEIPSEQELNEIENLDEGLPENVEKLDMVGDGMDRIKVENLINKILHKFNLKK